MKSHFTVILRPITLHLRVSLRGAGVRIIFAMYRRNPGREAVRSMAMVDRSPPGGVTSDQPSRTWPAQDWRQPLRQHRDSGLSQSAITSECPRPCNVPVYSLMVTGS